MKYINHNWINTLLIIGVGILVLVGGNQSEVIQVPVGGSTSANWTVGGNLAVTGTSAFTGAVSQSALATLNAGQLRSYTNSTSTTATTQTLVQADILNYDTVLFTPNTNAVTLTLPATAAIGDIIEVGGKGAGGWKLEQVAGQVIHFGTTNSTTGVGGSLASTNQYDVVRLICTTANTDFRVNSSIGTITVV